MRIDELFDDFIDKAKNVADVAGKKTGEVVSYNKLKYQAKQTQWDIEKAYAKLGAFIYESKKSTEDFSDLIALAINEIDLLNEKLDNLEQQILSCKRVVKCSGCGKENDEANCYCARCGNSLEKEKAEYEARERERQQNAEDVAEHMDEVLQQSAEEVDVEAFDNTKDPPPPLGDLDDYTKSE